MSTTSELRWVDAKGFSDLSVAVDEIYDLRAVCAETVVVIDDLLALKSLAAYRKSELVDLRARLLSAARGDRFEPSDWRKSALRSIGADECLTNAQWAEQRNLTARPTTPEEAAR